MPCNAYHAERNFIGKIGVCWGTKECEPCSCGGDESKCDFYAYVRNRAKNSSQNKTARWIPVAEQLPEILDTVIVSGRMKYQWEADYLHFVDVGAFLGKGFETFNDWYEGQDVFEITHWMPLPEPPEGKNDA